jgi:hypothetical protein
MRTTLLLLVLAAGSALASQTVWKWVDENGVTHYSDRAVPGATKMELRGNSSSATSSVAAEPESNTSSSEAVAAYADFSIFQPADAETVANTGGAVTVGIRLAPALKSGHSIFLYMDGKLLDGFRGDSLSFDLNEVPRGTHTLIAVINDTSNNRVQETELVTFTVRQESIAQPPVGPSMRSTPKPRPSGSAKLPASQPTYAGLNGSLPKMNPATNLPVKVDQPKPLPTLGKGP